MPYCTACGAELLDEDDYCVECGQRVGAAEPDAEPPPAATPDATTEAPTTPAESASTEPATTEATTTEATTTTSATTDLSAAESATTRGEPALDGDPRWRYAVYAPAYCLLAYFAAAFVAGFLTGWGTLTEAQNDALVDLFWQVYGVTVVATAVLAPFGVHRERNHVGTWTPHWLYYLSVVPVLNVLVAGAYYLHRRRETGGE